MILIVDDKAENIFSLKRTLELNGFEVDSAQSGEEALKKMLKNTYSLIILDVQMPGMDGFEVAEAMSGYSKVQNIPIIFLSAVNVDKKFITKGYTSGGLDYIIKPIDPDIFMLKVKTLHKLYEQNRDLNAMQQSLLKEIETRQRAEEDLNKSVKELRSILESIPQISFTVKPDGEIEFVNEFWYHYSASSKDFPEVHADDNAICTLYEQALATGAPLTSEIRILKLADQSYRYHQLKMIPVKEGGVVHKWVGTLTDIHEQKLATDLLELKVKERTSELLEKNNELAEKNHELQQFASVTSHDLKEPLRKIQIFSSIIKEKYFFGNTEVTNNMNRIIDASERMSKLINDLLSYSRLSMNSMFEPTDLNLQIDNILCDLEFIVAEKNAKIGIGDIPIIEAIPGQMRQVFQNLISNALKFSKKDVPPVINITSETFQEIENGEPRDLCRIIVADNGIGFDEKYLGKIFTIFQRLNPKDAYEGTGIGLAIVKKIIDKHNGSIKAESKEGEGASFIIVLPLYQVTDPSLIELI